MPQRAGSRALRRVRDWVPAAVVFVLVLLLWQKTIEHFHVREFMLPKPTAIWDAFRENRSSLLSAGWFTFKEALGGFAGGSAVAIVLALLLARFRRVAAGMMPFAIAANAVPIIAFAPITNNWFGAIEPRSKMAIAGVLCFFPVFANTLRGLTSVSPASIELMRSYAAGDVATFRMVRIPNALPFAFTGLKVASVLAMIGAVVGEYFGGSFEALGVIIQSNVALFNFPLAWAGIAVASAFGIAFYAAVALVEWLATRWQPSQALHTE